MRKYTEYIEKKGNYPFRTFLMRAIKESISNEVFKRLTQGNYEALQWQDDVDRTQINYLQSNHGGPVNVHWRNLKTLHFNMESFRYPVWLENLQSRRLDEADKKFIKKYQ